MSKRNICHQIRITDKRLRSIQYHLSVIEQDLQLKKDNWQVKYVIDFNVIWSYLFSIEKTLNSYGKNQKLEKSHSFKKLGQDYLFNKLYEQKKLVLLPSYAYEYWRYISEKKNSMKLDSISRYYGNEKKQFDKNLLEKKKTDLENINISLEKDCDSIRSNKNIARGIEIVRKYFRDYFVYFVSFNRSNEKRVMDFINKTSSCFVFLEDIENIDLDYDSYSMKSVINSKWYQYFEKKRTLSQNDLTDAQALMTLYDVNNKVVKDKIVMALVTESAILKECLNRDLYKKEEEINVPIGLQRINDTSTSIRDYRLLRTSKTFFILRNIEKENIDETLTEIKKWKDIIENYFIFSTAVMETINSNCEMKLAKIDIRKPSCDCCLLERNNRALLGEIDRINRNMDDLEKVDIIEKIDIKDIEDVNEVAKSTLLRVINVINNTNIRDQLQIEKEQLCERIDEALQAVPSFLVFMLTKEKRKAFAHFMSENKTIIYSMGFGNKTIYSVFDSLFITINDQRTDQSAEMRLMKILSDKEFGIEGDVLLAFLHYISGDYCIAMQKLETMDKVIGYNAFSIQSLKMLVILKLLRYSKDELLVQDINKLLTEYCLQYSGPQAVYILSYIKNRLFLMNIPIDNNWDETYHLMKEAYKQSKKEHRIAKEANDQKKETEMAMLSVALLNEISFYIITTEKKIRPDLLDIIIKNNKKLEDTYWSPQSMVFNVGCLYILCAENAKDLTRKEYFINKSNTYLSNLHGDILNFYEKEYPKYIDFLYRKKILSPNDKEP